MANGTVSSSGPTAVPQMQPVSFDGCFGWMHIGPASAASDTAVLLCSGIGRDASTGHRSFRMLADQLAAAGYPALRFDYRGTGDSCDAEDRECWLLWQQSLAAAADWLRARTQARRLVLIGLRLGGTLAALAASVREDVAALVLLEPVLRGKSYVGQLATEARLRSTPAAPGDGLVLNELRLGAETLRFLSDIDLRGVTFRPGCPVGVFSRSRTPVLSACEQFWAANGTPVHSADFAGLDPLLRPSHLSADEPHADFTPVLSWLRTAAPSHRNSLSPSLLLPDIAALRPAGCIETPLRFGADAHLFGMLCRPENAADADLAVIIGNTGGDPHHGFARFSVEFARKLARAGISSLRMDFAGLGDSSNPDGSGGETVTRIFETDRSPDLGAAMDMLEELGYRHFALNGLCSGAFHAFTGALADPRVGILLAINLPWFRLRLDKPGPASFARRSIAELSRRKVAGFFLFSAGDPGVKILEQHFGPGGAALRDFPGAAVSIVPGLDHDLTGDGMRQDAAERMIAFLRQHPASSSGISLQPRRDMPLTAEISEFPAPRHQPVF